MTDRYAKFDQLLFDRPTPLVLRVTLSASGKRNALSQQMHQQLEDLWREVDADPETRVTIVTGAGTAFCAGGSFDEMGNDAETDIGATFTRRFLSASNLVQALVESRKPIISAINGPAMGAGLAIALLADISIAAKTAKLMDGHLRIGLLPGDHAAIIWPLLCGMAKAKYYLMTNAVMTGEEAERQNLISLAVDAEELEEKSVAVASQLAGLAPSALAATKHVLNHWLRQARPIFETSLALEIAGMAGGEFREAFAAFTEKRAAKF
jgi:enoyl-CoA hydratase